MAAVAAAQGRQRCQFEERHGEHPNGREQEEEIEHAVAPGRGVVWQKLGDGRLADLLDEARNLEEGPHAASVVVKTSADYLQDGAVRL